MSALLEREGNTLNFEDVSRCQPIKKRHITCTDVSAWDRPLCSGNIWERQRENRPPVSFRMRRNEAPSRTFRLSHQLAVLVVGQDLRDVPVSRRDGLQSVRAGIRLRTRDGNVYRSRVHVNLTAKASDRTWETDMEMWKNLPLPPCGMARVKKSFSPSLENRGSSF